jgi:hypothetical protein
VVDGTSPENWQGVTAFVGSNPTLSANIKYKTPSFKDGVFSFYQLSCQLKFVKYFTQSFTYNIFIKMFILFP